MWSVCTMEIYRILKKNELFAKNQMELEIIVFIEISQIYKGKHCIFGHPGTQIIFIYMCIFMNENIMRPIAMYN